MTDENSQIREALGALEGRGGGGARDRISLRDYVVEAEIGAFQQERGRPQRLRFNVVVDLPPPGRLIEDDVDRILSYDVLTDAIAAELAAERLNLLETLAERIAARILQAPMAEQVILRIEKLDRVAGALGVEILRRKGDIARMARAAQGGPERIVWLAAEVLAAEGPEEEGAAAERLAAGLGRIIAETPACVILVGPPGEGAAGEAPGGAAAWAGDGAAGRRIALMGMGQMAVALAARVPGLEVIESRTELDWAMARRSAVVLAPEKIVRDAMAHPLPAGAERGPQIAAWLAARTGAPRLLIVGGDLPVAEGCAGEGLAAEGCVVERLDPADLAGPRA